MDETLKVKLLFEDSHIPSRGSEEAAGFDLCAAEQVTINPRHTAKVGTGIAVAIPKGYFGALFARSGLATKKGLKLANSVGVLDSDYRGEIIAAMYNDSNQPQVILKGDRIAQLVIIPYVSPKIDVVSDLDETERGEGGFGSTGR